MFIEKHKKLPRRMEAAHSVNSLKCVFMLVAYTVQKRFAVQTISMKRVQLVGTMSLTFSLPVFLFPVSLNECTVAHWSMLNVSLFSVEQSLIAFIFFVVQLSSKI